MSFNIFISYAVKDSAFFLISKIAESLKKLTFISNVWFSEHDVDTDFIDYMEKKLHDANLLLLFCSKNTQESRYVNIEWKSALVHNKPIIPIFSNLEDIPFILSSINGIKYNKDNFDSFLTEIISRVSAQSQMQESNQKNTKKIDNSVINSLLPSSSQNENISLTMAVLGSKEINEKAILSVQKIISHLLGNQIHWLVNSVGDFDSLIIQYLCDNKENVSIVAQCSQIYDYNQILMKKYHLQLIDVQNEIEKIDFDFNSIDGLVSFQLIYLLKKSDIIIAFWNGTSYGMKTAIDFFQKQKGNILVIQI